MESAKQAVKKRNKSHSLLRVRKFVLSAPFLAAFISVCILTSALMFKPVIGMADNGDFYRTMTSSGLYKLDRYEDDQFFNYASTTFGKFKYYNEYATGFSSSQTLFINFAVFLDSVFTSDTDRFDIRFLGAIMILLFAFAQYLLVYSLTYRAKPVARYIIAALSVYTFTDLGYTAYFNSFYAEGIVLCAFLLSMTSIVLLVEKRLSPVFLSILFILSSLLLITSKQQNAPLGVLLALTLLFIPFFRKRSEGLPDSARTLLTLKRLAVPLAAVLCVSGIVVYLMISQVYVHTNSYHAMTRGVLLTSKDPEETLKEFNINQQYSILNGTTFYDDTPVIDVESDLMTENFYDRYGFVSIAVYYASHPGYLYQMLNLAIKDAWKIRPASDGNYDKSAGFSPGAQTSFFTMHSAFLLNYIPRSFGYVIIWLIVCLLINHKSHGRLLVIISAFLMGVSQLLVSIIGAGDADIGKHIFLFNVVYDYVTLMTLSQVIIWIRHQISKNIAKKKVIPVKISKQQSSPPEKSVPVLKSSTVVKAAAMLSVLALLLFVSDCRAVQAAEIYEPENASDSSSDILLVCRNDTLETSVNNLINAFGKSAYEISGSAYSGIPDKIKYVITTEQKVADDANAMGIKPFCIGSGFSSDDDLKISSVPNTGITAVFERHSQYSGFFDSVPLAVYTGSSSDPSSGTLRTSGGVEYPFYVESTGGWYAPWYQDNDLTAVMLSNALKKYTGADQDGQMYVLLDEVYPFSSFDQLKAVGEKLYKCGIPFIIRIMPVYTNLDYPSIQRYTRFLRYMQSLDGTVVIHDSIIQNSDYDPDTLEDNLNAFKKVLSEQGVYYYPMKNAPLTIDCDLINSIKSGEKNFGSFPISTMISLDYSDDDSFQKDLDSINSSWLTVNDYLLLYSNIRHSYTEGTVNENYQYVTEEKKAFSGLMTYGNRVLMVVIIISLVVYTVIILFGIRLYKNKFRKKR